MTEKAKQVIDTAEKLMPRMTEVEQAQLLGYCEGLAAREDREPKETKKEEA